MLVTKNMVWTQLYAGIAILAESLSTRSSGATGSATRGALVGTEGNCTSFEGSVSARCFTSESDEMTDV